jgi:hypothetical protein
MFTHNHQSFSMRSSVGSACCARAFTGKHALLYGGHNTLPGKRLVLVVVDSAEASRSLKPHELVLFVVDSAEASRLHQEHKERLEQQRAAHMQEQVFFPSIIVSLCLY